MKSILLLILILLSGCSLFRDPSSKRLSEQTKSVDAIRDIGTAIEAYKLTNGRFPIGRSGHLEEIEDLVVPTFLAALPRTDGWGNEIEYYCMQSEGPYYIISLGSDKERDMGLYTTGRSPSGLGFRVISEKEEDIIFSNGVFVRYPEGTAVVRR